MDVARDADGENVDLRLAGSRYAYLPDTPNLVVSFFFCDGMRKSLP